MTLIQPSRASSSTLSAAARAPAQTIDEVITRLDAIIEQALIDGDRLGLFAVLYRTVTAAVKEGIAAGRFDDGPRMERLDVVFANRYLDAFDRYRRGEAVTQSWRAAFEAGSHSRVVIMQHLLLGMNAHINLDLGIAAAEVCPGAMLAPLEREFNEINNVLATLETSVEREVCSLSPWIGRLVHVEPRAGRVIANFSMNKARAAAWATAQRLASLSGAARDAAIAGVDADVALLSRLIERPIGFMINLNLLLVRLRETHDVRNAIRVLGGQAV